MVNRKTNENSDESKENKNNKCNQKNNAHKEVDIDKCKDESNRNQSTNNEKSTSTQNTDMIDMSTSTRSLQRFANTDAFATSTQTSQPIDLSLHQSADRPETPLIRPNISLLMARIDIAQMVPDEVDQIEELAGQLRATEAYANRAEQTAREARSDADALRILVNGLRASNSLIAPFVNQSSEEPLRPIRQTFSEQLTEMNNMLDTNNIVDDEPDDGDDSIERMIMDMVNMNHNLRPSDDINNIFPFFVQHEWPMVQWPDDPFNNNDVSASILI